MIMMMSINLVMNLFTDILPMTEMYHFHLFQFFFFVFVCLSLQIQIILTVTALQSLMPLNQLLDQKCKNIIRPCKILCHPSLLYSHLLVVFTRQLEILVTALHFCYCFSIFSNRSEQISPIQMPSQNHQKDKMRECGNMSISDSFAWNSMDQLSNFRSLIIINHCYQ